MYTKIYTVIDHGKKQKYKFIGALSSEISKIFDKHNKNSVLSDSEKNTLKKNYGKSIVDSIKDCVIINCYIYPDDSINTVKKKIETFCEDVNNYNNLHLWAKTRKMPYNLENEYKNFLLEQDHVYDVDVSLSSPLNKVNRDQVRLNLSVCLGIEYRIENGIRIMPMNPLNFPEDLEISFKDLKVDRGSKILNYYGEITNDTINFLTLNSFEGESSLSDDLKEKVGRYYFPNSVKDEEERSYNDLIKEYNAICNKYTQITTDETLKINESYRFIEDEVLKNIVISFGLNLNNDLDLETMFAELSTNNNIPYIKYKDASRNSVFKINDNSVSPKAEKVLARDDFKNYKTYFTPFISGYYSPQISLDTLESWKNNKYSLKEKYLRKSRKNINLLNDLCELTFKVKYGDNYYTVIIRNNGTVYFQLFDIDYNRNVISSLINNLMIILNRNGVNVIDKNISKIDNLTSSFKYLKYDVDREFLVSNTEIPLETFNLAILEKRASEMYPFCFVTYDSENVDTIILKYIRVNENESNNNYINFFLKLQNSSKKLGVEKFRKLWEEQSRLVFNLSSLETNGVFERVIEQVQDENMKKEGVEIYSTISIKLKDQFEDKLVYNVSIQNVSDTEELRRIETFVQYLFYVSGVKQRTRKASVSKSPSRSLNKTPSSPVSAPVIKLQEVQTTTFADEDEMDFDFEEESGDEGDEFEYDYESENEEGEVVTLSETVASGSTDEAKAEPEPEEVLPEQKLNLAKLSFRKYMGDMRKIKDNKLFNYTTSKLYEQYSRICGSSDMRQPIILTRAEYNNFKIKNLEAFNQTSFLEWGSSASSLNYYICPRIWCIRDKIALTPKQLVNNGGRCPFCNGNIINLKDKVIGEDNTVIIRKGGSNNYWKTTAKKSKAYQSYLASLKEGEPDNWNLYLKETEKDAYPGLLHPKQHPNKLCMPCCNTELHKEKNFDKCKGMEINYTNYLNKKELSQKIREGEVEVSIKIKDLKEGFIVDGKSIHRGDTVMVLNQYPDYKREEDMGTDKFKLITELVGFFTITKTGSKKITKFTNLEIDLESNMNITITSGSLNKDHIFTLKKQGGKFVFGEPEPKDEADKSYILGAEKFPIDVKDKYGFLSENLNKLFKNSLDGLIEKGKIINTKKANLFLRKGVDQNYLYSFLSAIASIREVSINGLIRRVVENLTPEIFVSLNCGELVKLFGENPEVLFDKKLESSFVKWCNVYKDFVVKFGDGIKNITLADVKPDNEKISRLIVVYFGFEYYKKYIGDLNVFKDIDYLWDLFGRKIPGVFDNGLNIVIIEDSKTRVNVLCPNVDDSSLFYSMDKPTCFLLKKRDENGTLYEPIVFVSHNSGEIDDQTIIETGAFKTAENIVNMVQKSCVSTYPKNQSSYGFTKGITLNDFITKNSLDVVSSIIIDDYMKGLGVILKTGNHLFLEPFSVLPGINVVYKRNIKAIDFDKFTEIVKSQGDLSVNKYIVKGDDVVGVLTRDGNIYKVKSKKKQSEMDISKRKIIDFSVMSKAMIDERILVINKYEKKKRQYEMFLGEISSFFKKNYRGLKKLNFYKKLGLIIRNRLKTIVEKKVELVNIFTQILDNITERVKVIDPVENKIENYCVISSGNKCKKTKKCSFKKGNRSFKIKMPEDIQINQPNCLLKIEESYYKLFINKIVDQILRSNIKRNLILTGKYRETRDISDETIVKTDDYSSVLSDLFTKQVNIYLAEMPKAEIGKVKQISDMENLDSGVVDEQEGIFATTIGWNKKDYKDIPNIVAGECKFPFYKKVSVDGKVVHRKFMKCIPYKVDGIDAGYACPTKTGKFGVGVEWGFCPENTSAEFLSDSVKSNPPSRRGSRSRSPSPQVSSPKSKSKPSEFKSSISRFFLDSNYAIVPKPMDGDCFFHSFTGGLPREFNINAMDLRRLVVETVSDKDLIEWGGIFTNLIETINSKKASKLEKANARDALKDFKHLEGVVSLEDLKRNMMSKRIFWANDWAIATAQFLLNIKVIILDVRNYENDPVNAIKCDIDARKNVTKCAFPGCGMTHEELILKQNGLLPPALDKKYTHDGDHIWNDHTEVESYDFKGFVIVEYDGSHYNLVSYNDKTFFLPGELPSNLIEKIQMYCIEPDRNKNNIFSKMSNILTKKASLQQPKTEAKPKSKKLVRRKKESVSYTPGKLGTWVEQPNKAVLGSFKVPGATGAKGRDTLNEAKRVCNEHPGCMGITRKKKENSKFTLRTGPKTKDSSSENSWIKKDKYHPVKSVSPKAKAKSASPSPSSSPKAKAKTPTPLSSVSPKAKKTQKKQRVLVQMPDTVPSGYTRLPGQAVETNLPGVPRRKDLSFALEQAKLAGDKCSGFVMGKDGKFALRTGRVIKKNKNTKNEVLYIKNKFLPRDQDSGSESD